MKIKIYDTAKCYKMYAEDGRVLVVAYKGKNSLNAFLHKDFNTTWKKIDGTFLKSSLETHPDNYEYQLSVRKTEKSDALAVLKEILSKNFKDVQFSNVKNRPDAKKKAPAKKETKSAPKGQTLKNGATLVKVEEKTA